MYNIRPCTLTQQTKEQVNSRSKIWVSQVWGGDATQAHQITLEIEIFEFSEEGAKSLPWAFSLFASLSEVIAGHYKGGWCPAQNIRFP